MINGKKIVLTGNPLNEHFLVADRQKARQKLGLSDTDFYLLSFAGSLGAREINKVFVDFISNNCKNNDFIHTHASGSFGFKWMPSQLLEKGVDITKNNPSEVLEYIYDMPERLAACDLVISRAGAITLGEITALCKPSILIPSPNVTNNHQYHNAMSLVNKGAAMIMEEKDVTADKLYSMVLSLKNDKDLLKSLGKNAGTLAKLGAAEQIYTEVYTIIKQ